MRTIRRGGKVIGALDDVCTLHTNDRPLMALYFGWVSKGIPVLTPVVSPPGIFADGTEMVKPSAETAGVVRWALEREGYSVE